MVFDEFYKAPIFRYREISEVPWADFQSNYGKRVRIIIQAHYSQLPLDMLYIPRDRRELLVGFHGAELQKEGKFPKFQFLRSFIPDRTESLLFVSDSTLLMPGMGNIGWMVGNSSIDIGIAYQKAIHAMVASLGVGKVVLVGHSAGGTAAIRVGAGIPNSTAVAVNPQLSAALHRSWVVTKIRKALFPECKSNDSMIESYRDRFDLWPTISSEREGKFAWFAHADDSVSMTDYPHFPTITSLMDLPWNGGMSDRGDRLFLGRWETSNPNKHALPGAVLPFMKVALGEEDERVLNPV